MSSYNPEDGMADWQAEEALARAAYEHQVALNAELNAYWAAEHEAEQRAATAFVAYVQGFGFDTLEDVRAAYANVVGYVVRGPGGNIIDKGCYWLDMAKDEVLIAEDLLVDMGVVIQIGTVFHLHPYDLQITGRIGFTGAIVCRRLKGDV